MTMEKEKPINIKLLSVEETSIVNNYGGKDLSGLSEDVLSFQFKVNVMVSPAKETLTVDMAVRYRYDNADLFLAESKTVFVVKSLDEIITRDESKNTITFSFDIVPTLVGASYSTLRGIVYKETKNGPLEKYPMPLMPMKVLVEKCVFSIEDEQRNSSIR